MNTFAGLTSLCIIFLGDMVEDEGVRAGFLASSSSLGADWGALFWHPDVPELGNGCDSHVIDVHAVVLEGFHRSCGSSLAGCS